MAGPHDARSRSLRLRSLPADWLARTSEHFGKDRAELLERLAVNRAAPPLVDLPRDRPLQIIVESLHQCRGKRWIDGGDGELVVRLERSVVEVRGTEHAELTIHNHHL